MENLLETYLKNYYNVDYIYIFNYYITDATCKVNFCTDENRDYKERMSINIWDMLVFLNNK
jgi:hypothetical protein